MKENKNFEVGQEVQYFCLSLKRTIKAWIAGIYIASSSPGVSLGGYEYAVLRTEFGASTQVAVECLSPI